MDKYTNFLPKYYTEATNFGTIPLTLWKRKLLSKNNASFELISYCIMTSATTGEPKIVKVARECITSNIIGLRNVFKVTETDVIYFGTPLTFDPSMVEVFLALITGCTLVIPPKFRRFILDVLFPSNACHRGVTILQIVPSLLLHWNDADLKYLLEKSSCRVLALGGEKFPEEIVKRTRSKYLKIFNLYGVTEVSCWASTFEITNDTRVILGDPLPDTILEVRTDSGEVITNGRGELFIGSYSRICYVDDEDAATITPPLFRATGDLVQIKDSDISYLGRINSMIKRLGHKINLLDVQERVLQHTTLRNACIWYEDEYKMILFVEIKEFNEAVKKRIVDKLRVKLLHVLPRECFPDHIEIIPSIPLSEHGKVDLRTLKDIYQKLICTDNEQRPVDIFTILWCKYLGLSINSIDKFENCTFLELGGNSIAVLQCLSEVKCTLNDTEQNDLTTLLFEKTFKECCNFISHLEAVPYKKLKKTKCVNDIQQSAVEGPDSIELKIAWRYDLEACVDSTPTVVDEKIVSIGSFSHKFVSLNAVTGTLVSHTILPDAIEGACCAIPSTSYICTGCYDGHLYCIDIRTGCIMWKYKSGDQIKCTPAVYENNNSVTFGSYDKMLYSVNYNNGELIWKKDIFGSVTSNPTIHNDKVYVATTLGSCCCFSVLSGEQIWNYNVNIPIFGSPALIIQLSMVAWITVNGTLTFLSCDNGKKITDFQVDGNVFSGLCNFEDRVVFGCSNHKVYCVQIVDNQCQLCYVVTLESSITATPHLFKYLNQLLCTVATNKGCVCIMRFECGKILGKLKLEGEIFSSPVVSNELLYIGCRDNNLHCISFRKK